MGRTEGCGGGERDGHVNRLHLEFLKLEFGLGGYLLESKAADPVFAMTLRSRLGKDSA